MRIHHGSFSAANRHILGFCSPGGRPPGGIESNSSSMLLIRILAYPCACTTFIWPSFLTSKQGIEKHSARDWIHWIHFNENQFTASNSVQCIHLKGLQLSQGQQDLFRAASKSHPLERSWRPAEKAHLNFDMAMLGNPRNPLITFWHEFEIHLSLSH